MDVPCHSEKYFHSLPLPRPVHRIPKRRVERLMCPLPPVSPRRCVRLARCPRSKLLTSRHSLKARACSSLAEKTTSTSSSLYDRFPSPKLSGPHPRHQRSSRPLSMCRARLSTHPHQLHGTKTDLAQPSLRPSAEVHILPSESLTYQQKQCLPLLPAKGLHLVSLDHTRVRRRVFIEVWKHHWPHFFVCSANFSMVTSALALSTVMNCLNSSMVRCLPLSASSCTTIPSLVAFH